MAGKFKKPRRPATKPYDRPNATAVEMKDAPLNFEFPSLSRNENEEEEMVDDDSKEQQPSTRAGLLRRQKFEMRALRKEVSEMKVQR